MAGLVGLLALGLVPGPVAAGTPQPPTYSIFGGAPLKGVPKPYHSSFYSTDDFIGFALQRRATTGTRPTQRHDWSVGETQMTCVANLSSCNVDDQVQLGTAGAIDLHFAPTGPRTTHKELCEDDTTVFGTETKRKGILTGTFRIATGTDFFGTIRNGGTHARVPAKYPVTVTKEVLNGTDCPSGPGGPPTCFTFLGFGMFTEHKYAIGQKSSTDPKAGFQVAWQPNSGLPNLQVSHSLFGTGPKSAIHVTVNSPVPLTKGKADFSALAPFVSGPVATFFGTEDPEIDSGDCPSVSRDGTLDIDLDAHFDGWGIIHFGSGPGGSAQAPYPAP